MKNKQSFNFIDFVIYKTEILFLISVACLSFLLTSSFYDLVIAFATLCIAAILCKLYKEKNYQFPNMQSPIFTILLAVPIVLINGYASWNAMTAEGLLFIPVFLLSTYSLVVLAVLLSTWIANNIIRVLRSFNRKEIILAICCFAFLSTITVIAHLSSRIFGFSSQQAMEFDVILGLDSGLLQNEFYTIGAEENNIKSCLFGVFAQPVYFYATILHFVTRLSIGTCICLIQNILLVLSAMMLSKMIESKCNILLRSVIVIALCLLFPVLVYSMTLEQYPISCFFVMLLIYNAINHNDDMTYIDRAATSTTLLTSAALFGVGYSKFDTNNKKSYLLKLFADVLISALFLLFLVFVYGQSSIIIDSVQQTQEVLIYSTVGQKTDITLLNKIQQYSHFVTSSFVSPKFQIANTGINKIYSIVDIVHHTPSIIQENVTAINPIGCAIFALSIIGLCFGIKTNDDRKLSIISLFWIVVSMATMIILGWGAPENGFVIYTLYFGWPFFVGCYLLLKRFVPLKIRIILICMLIVYMLIHNGQAVYTLIDFAKTHYPVLKGSV